MSHYNMGKKLLPRIWELSEIITNKERIVIKYIRQDKKETISDIKPVSIMFSMVSTLLLIAQVLIQTFLQYIEQIGYKIEKTNEKIYNPVRK